MIHRQLRKLHHLTNEPTTANMTGIVATQQEIDSLFVLPYSDNHVQFLTPLPHSSAGIVQKSLVSASLGWSFFRAKIVN